MANTLMVWGPAAFWAAVLFLLSEVEGHPGPRWLPVNDKVAHLGLYLVLGAGLAWAQRQGAGLSSRTLVLLGLCYGALDEWHQSLVPGRDPSLGDWVADAAGVALGFLLLRIYLGAPTSDPRKP